MTDQEVGEEWKNSFDPNTGEVYREWEPCIKFITKIVEDRALYKYACGVRGDDENWRYCIGLALKDFGIDQASYEALAEE